MELLRTIIPGSSGRGSIGDGWIMVMQPVGFVTKCGKSVLLEPCVRPMKQKEAVFFCLLEKENWKLSLSLLYFSFVLYHCKTVQTCRWL
mmetsp:Transcript_7950/g.12283  ORF Transcript_7950/g.12283 Transcript_7950/m.12283 type:complete len:89 (-) Transcript_7950:63-329(-)